MDGEDVSVVLIPGFMLDQSMWDDLTDYLPPTWILHRAKLEGGSSIQEIARQIVEESPKQFVLIGFSLGGYVAREIAGKFPERVTALIIIASSMREDTEEQLVQKRQALGALSSSTFSGLSPRTIAKSLHPDRSGDSELIGRIRQMCVRLGRSAFATQSGLRRTGIPTSEIRCPTLVIAGAQDALRSHDEARELRDSIPSAVLETVEDTGHMIPLEQPRRLGVTITKWIHQAAAK